MTISVPQFSPLWNGPWLSYWVWILSITEKMPQHFPLPGNSSHNQISVLFPVVTTAQCELLWCHTLVSTRWQPYLSAKFLCYSSPTQPGPQWLGGKESACKAGDVGLITGVRRPHEEEMATHSSIFAWKIPMDRLQSMVAKSQTWLWAHTHTHTQLLNCRSAETGGTAGITSSLGPLGAI